MTNDFVVPPAIADPPSRDTRLAEAFTAIRRASSRVSSLAARLILEINISDSVLPPDRPDNNGRADRSKLHKLDLTAGCGAIVDSERFTYGKPFAACPIDFPRGQSHRERREKTASGDARPFQSLPITRRFRVQRRCPTCVSKSYRE